MKSDITIEVRFRTTEEGGRSGPVVGAQFSCPMLISGEAFDCRLLTEGQPLHLGEIYDLPVKFLNADVALPKLSEGMGISLWEGRVIADGKVLSLGA